MNLSVALPLLIMTMRQPIITMAQESNWSKRFMYWKSIPKRFM